MHNVGKKTLVLAVLSTAVIQFTAHAENADRTLPDGSYELGVRTPYIPHFNASRDFLDQPNRMYALELAGGTFTIRTRARGDGTWTTDVASQGRVGLVRGENGNVAQLGIAQVAGVTLNSEVDPFVDLQNRRGTKILGMRIQYNKSELGHKLTYRPLGLGKVREGTLVVTTSVDGAVSTKTYPKIQITKVGPSWDKGFYSIGPNTAVLLKSVSSPKK